MTLNCALNSLCHNNEIKVLYAPQYEVWPNKTYISSSPAELVVGNDSHEVPFYRVNALSSDGFIGEGSNETRWRGRISASTFRFFAGAKLLWSHGGVLRIKGRVRDGKESSPPARDPGRPIPRYGYGYEKYGNSALKDVKWPGDGGLYRHIGTQHLWRSINVMYARRFCPGIEIGWRGERHGRRVSPKGLGSRGTSRVALQTLHGPRSSKQRWMDR